MPITKSTLARQTKEELKKTCEDLGLDSSGVKIDLVKRVFQYYQTNEQQDTDVKGQEPDDLQTQSKPTAEEPIIPPESSAQLADEGKEGQDISDDNALIMPDTSATSGKPTPIKMTEQVAAVSHGIKRKASATLADTPVKKMDIKKMTNEERMKQRQRRFQGNDCTKSDAEVLAARAARFGGSSGTSKGQVGGADDKQKLLARAERFGVTTPETENEKRKQRAERFNVPHPELEKQKLLSRAQRFNVETKETIELKMAARKERFGAGGLSGANALAGTKLKSK